MTDETSTPFPLVITFEKDNLSKTFLSFDEAQQWATSEFNFWSSMSGGRNSASLHHNRDSTRQIVNAKDAVSAANALQKISASLFLSDGGLGRILASEKDPDVRAIAFNLATGADSSSYNLTLGTVRAQVYAAIAQSVGDPIAAREQLGALIQEVHQIRLGDDAALKRLKDLIAKAELDWSSRIEGYEAKVALSAPRDYWKGRAEKHEAEAKAAKKLWERSLIVTVVVTIGMSSLLFSAWGEDFLGKGTNLTEELASIIKRAILLATSLAFGVWWLRQKLRDLRSHEHLAEDAAERVTMIETFAALRGAGLSAGDLSQVLAALYRPATTGFIDDSGPVLPIEVLMKGAADTVTRASGK